MRDHKDAFRKICEHLLEVLIEAEAYRCVAAARGASPSELEFALEAAQVDPQIRQLVHQEYFAIWTFVEETGDDALFEDLLENLFTPEKPN